ncbi:alpha-2,3-sialyltransferase [Helicobacter sp. 23-1044]
MVDFSASYKCHKRDSLLVSLAQNDNLEADSAKSAIIAGNAPSLAQIDYSRLPLNFEVFRCNQFYFEKKYYLGKKVRAVCFANQALFEQIYTMLLLNNRGEYSVDSAFLNNFYAFGLEGAEFSQNMEIFTSAFRQNIFINRIFDGAHSHKIAEFLEFAVLNQLYNFAHPTSGIWLCAIAVALGFREIYIAGIDFYRGEKVYAFDTLARNFCSFDTNMRDYITAREQHNAPHTEGYHSKAFDLQCLEFLAKHYGAKFYSLCPQSPISQNLPLAPKTNNSFIPQDKPKDFINDVQIPPKEAYLQFFSPHFKERVKHIKSPARIKTNIYFRALRDAMRLFGDLKLFLKHRKERDKNDESI